MYRFTQKDIEYVIKGLEEIIEIPDAREKELMEQFRSIKLVMESTAQPYVYIVGRDIDKL